MLDNSEMTSNSESLWIERQIDGFFLNSNSCWPCHFPVGSTQWSTTLSSKVYLPSAINLRALCVANLAPIAAEREGNYLKGLKTFPWKRFKDLSLKVAQVKARIWPWLPYKCQIARRTILQVPNRLDCLTSAELALTVLQVPNFLPWLSYKCQITRLDCLTSAKFSAKTCQEFAMLDLQIESPALKSPSCRTVLWILYEKRIKLKPFW